MRGEAGWVPPGGAALWDPVPVPDHTDLPDHRLWQVQYSTLSTVSVPDHTDIPDHRLW